MLSRDDILATYAAGPEAVVKLVETLLTAPAELRQQVAKPTARVVELEVRLNKDSHNSHQPPSSDPAPDGGGRCGLAKKNPGRGVCANAVGRYAKAVGRPAIPG